MASRTEALDPKGRAKPPKAYSHRAGRRLYSGRVNWSKVARSSVVAPILASKIPWIGDLNANAGIAQEVSGVESKDALDVVRKHEGD